MRRVDTIWSKVMRGKSICAPAVGKSVQPFKYIIYQ